jgi:hypothetical protein
MAEVKQQSGQRIVDYMSRDYDSILSGLRAQIPDKLPEWTDFESEADFGNVLLQLFAHMGDIISYYQDRIANECFLGTARERRSIIQHLSLIGYSLSTAAPASTKLTISVADTVGGEFRLSQGDAFATKSTKEKPSVRFEYNGSDITINLDSFQTDPQNPGSKIYTVPVEQGRRIRNDLIGISDGTPNQRFKLNFSPLILRSTEPSETGSQEVELRSELGTDIRSWALQESLAFSLENQFDYVIEIDEDDQATLVFGDGILGAIPPAGAQLVANYRVGGGPQGNVSANSIDTIVDAPALNLLSATVSNRLPATGGAQRESISHAVQHAPKVFRSQKRAVTAEDYQALALNFKGVGKVRALPSNWNRVTLHVAPDGGGRVSDILIANLLAYFENKRPLSTLIEIADVDYVRVYVAARIGLESYYSRDEMKKKIEAIVADLLAFENVDFGEVIYLSKFYEAIEAIDGVSYVTISEFFRAGDAQLLQPEGRIQLADNELPRLPGSDVDDPASDLDYSTSIKLISIEGGY